MPRKVKFSPLLTDLRLFCGRESVLSTDSWETTTELSLEAIDSTAFLSKWSNCSCDIRMTSALGMFFSVTGHFTRLLYFSSGEVLLMKGSIRIVKLFTSTLKKERPRYWSFMKILRIIGIILF